MHTNFSWLEEHDNSTTNEKFDEDDSSFTVVLSFLGVVGILIILANATVFFLTARRAYLRTKTNAILVSLAASDFMAGALCIPLIIACSMMIKTEPCTAMELAQRFLAISTVLHLLAATVERYIKIVAPLRYLSILTDRKVAIVLCSIWTTSLFSSVIQLAWMNTDEQNEDTYNSDAIYSLFCSIAFVLLPFIVMVVAYAHIFYVIRREGRTHLFENTEISRGSKKRRKNEIRAAFIYVSMVVVFLLAWSGYFISTFIDDIGNDILNRFPWLDIVLLFMKFSTAFINPLLYTFFKADFQSALNSFRRKATSVSSTSTQFVSLNTLANLGTVQNDSPLLSKYAGHGKRSCSVPNCASPRQKTVRSESLGVFV